VPGEPGRRRLKVSKYEAICLGVVITAFLTFCLTVLLMGKTGVDPLMYDLYCLIKLVPNVQLEKQDQQELQKALASYSLDGCKPVQEWIDGLRQHGKTGILPRLPKQDYDGTTWVNGKCVLLKKDTK
jgi:hypothetical protein